MWRGGGRSALGQTPSDQGLHGFLATLGTQAELERGPKSFRTSWEKVRNLVEYVVYWGVQHRNLGPIFAIGVDEIQYAKGHKYLTFVYQIDDLTRLLWVGKERTEESFQKAFSLIGREQSLNIELVCSDMWKHYLNVIRERCSQAIHIPDRFHIVAKINKALDEVRAAEARLMAEAGHEPLLKKTRWCLLIRKRHRRTAVPPLGSLRFNLKTGRAYLLKEDFQQFWEYESPA